MKRDGTDSALVILALGMLAGVVFAGAQCLRTPTPLERARYARIRELETAVAQYSAQIETAKARGDWPSPMAGEGR